MKHEIHIDKFDFIKLPNSDKNWPSINLTMKSDLNDPITKAITIDFMLSL